MRTPTTFMLALALAAAGCGKGDASAKKAADKADQATPAEPGEPGAAPTPGKRPKDERRLFDLADNRLLAHVQRGGGLVVMPGSGGFAKYTHFGKPKLGWKLKQSVDGKQVGIAEKYVDVDVPLTAEQAKSGKVTLRLKSTKARALELKPNGGKGASVQLTADGWQTITADVPGLRAGENRVQLVTGGKGDNLAIEWIQFGGTPAGDAAPTFWNAEQKLLTMPRGGGLTYFVVVPKDGQLVGVSNKGCTIKVRAAAEGGKPVTGEMVGVDEVNLASLAGQTVRLDLSVDDCDNAVLADAGLAVAGAPIAVKKADKPKYVVIWVMDSLRADRTRPFNPKARPDAPNFEKLSQKGAAFVRNYVQGNESKASHASIWSSTWVGTHRFIPGANKNLDGKFVTLGEIGHQAGFLTSGVSANGYIIKKWGFGDGWDKYRNNIHDGGGLRGEDLLKLAIESVEGGKDKPFFLYIGTIDTHVSWRAKEPWMSKYDPEPYDGKYKKEASGTDIEKLATSGTQPSERDKQRIIAIYDSNVSYQDDLLGKLYDKLVAWGIADQTMIIVTADHGDEQWENGRVGHGGSLRESLTHTPLLIVYPPLIPGGIVDEGTDTIDILPTIIDALGMAPSDGMQGESLIPLAQGVGRGYPRCSIASQYENAWAMRIGDWKVRVAGSGVPMLYNLAADYYEKQDLAESRHLERRLLTDALATFLYYQKDWKKRDYGSANNMKGKAAEDWL